MKKLLGIVILCFLFSGNAYAEWTIASVHKNKTTEFYIDKDNIRKEGSTRYFWILMNLNDKKVDRKYKSSLAYVQLDCSIFRAKDLKFFAKSLPMGKGEIISEFNPPDEWKYPIPGSNEEKVYKFVCDL
tara:strand:- start:84 stop:470 length:387 start_codon:yes stop_codon:yes gene_type:complete